MNPDDVRRRPATDFTAHRPPALLVARILEPPGDGGAEGRVALAAHAGLDGLQLCEAAAQSVAVLHGCTMAPGADGAADPGPFRGLLVGVRDFAIAREALPGEGVTVAARLDCQLGGLRIYAVRALGAEDAMLASGELKVYDPREGEA